MRLRKANGSTAQRIEPVEHRQLQHQVHGPDGDLQQDQQGGKGEKEQRSVDEGPGQALHHGGGHRHAGVVHGVLDVFRQILPHVAVQTDERKQIQKIASVVHIRLRHLHLAGFLRQGIFHPLLHMLRQQRRHQFVTGVVSAAAMIPAPASATTMVKSPASARNSPRLAPPAAKAQPGQPPQRYLL